MTQPRPAPTALTMPSGRRLDVYVAGPSDGAVLLFHTGTPTAPIPFAPADSLGLIVDALTASGPRIRASTP